MQAGNLKRARKRQSKVLHAKCNVSTYHYSFEGPSSQLSQSAINVEPKAALAECSVYLSHMISSRTNGWPNLEQSDSP